MCNCINGYTYACVYVLCERTNPHKNTRVCIKGFIDRRGVWSFSDTRYICYPSVLFLFSTSPFSSSLLSLLVAYLPLFLLVFLLRFLLRAFSCSSLDPISVSLSSVFLFRVLQILTSLFQLFPFLSSSTSSHSPPYPLDLLHFHSSLSSSGPPYPLPTSKRLPQTSRPASPL